MHIYNRCGGTVPSDTTVLFYCCRITNIATAFEITNSVVRVITIDKDSYGDYYCNATNKMGHDVARINLFGKRYVELSRVVLRSSIAL